MNGAIELLVDFVSVRGKLIRCIVQVTNRIRSQFLAFSEMSYYYICSQLLKDNNIKCSSNVRKNTSFIPDNIPFQSVNDRP